MSDDRETAETADLVDSLDFSGPPRLRGRPATTLATHVRDLGQADLAALASAPRASGVPQSLQRVRASHHALARCLATGMSAHQAGLVTGYSPSRISILLSDPAFRGLLDEYTADAKSIVADMAERMSNISLDALDELQQRLEESPESFSTPMLLDVVKAFADRTGHGPGQRLDVALSATLIDRPPKESFEDWRARRQRELGQEITPEGVPRDPLDSIDHPSWPRNAALPRPDKVKDLN